MNKPHRKLTCLEMEVIMSKKWDIRRHLIIPNVSWGMGIHECDLLIVSESGYCTEVEIKVSKADLKKDASKRHGHNSDKIKYLFFAIPDYLNTPECIAMIPERAGIYVVSDYVYRDRTNTLARLIRTATANPRAKKLDEESRSKLMRLGCMRIWGLKSKLLDLKKTKP